MAASPPHPGPDNNAAVAALGPRPLSVRAPKFDDLHMTTPPEAWDQLEGADPEHMDAIVTRLCWSQVWGPMAEGTAVEFRFPGLQGADLWELLDILYMEEENTYVRMWDADGTTGCTGPRNTKQTKRKWFH